MSEDRQSEELQSEEIDISTIDFEEINHLINLRQYVANSIGNPTIDRPTVNYMNGLMILLDKKIIELLKSKEFKKYINYHDVKKAIIDVAQITNIRSGLKQ